jgi:hypothetical protein
MIYFGDGSHTSFKAFLLSYLIVENILLWGIIILERI